jgi:glycerophosphoryl diester phosphodiesterase
MTKAASQRLAHRGTLRDENTWLGISAALASEGVDGVEVDLQISRDGVVFLHHDRTLQRRAGRPESPLDLDWSVLAELPLARGERLLRLDMLLERWPKNKRLNLELKDGGQRLVEATLAATQGRDDVVLSSFGIEMLEACRAQAAPHPCALLLEVESASWLHASGAQQLGCDTVHVQADLVSAALVERHHGAGVAVGVWGAGSRERELACEALGIERVISDFLVPDPSLSLGDD